MRKSVLLFIIVAVTILTAGCSDALSNNVGTSSNSQKDSVLDFGSSVTIDGVSFKPIKAVSAQKIGTETTTNQYVIITIDAENGNSKAITITSGQFVLIDDQNRQYKESTTDFIFDLDSYFSIADDINPGLKKSGQIVFEVPADSHEFVLAIRADMFDFGGADYKYIRIKV